MIKHTQTIRRQQSHFVGLVLKGLVLQTLFAFFDIGESAVVHSDDINPYQPALSTLQEIAQRNRDVKSVFAKMISSSVEADLGNHAHSDQSPYSEFF